MKFDLQDRYRNLYLRACAFFRRPFPQPRLSLSLKRMQTYLHFINYSTTQCKCSVHSLIHEQCLLQTCLMHQYQLLQTMTWHMRSTKYFKSMPFQRMTFDSHLLQSYRHQKGTMTRSKGTFLIWCCLCNQTDVKFTSLIKILKTWKANNQNCIIFAFFSS